MNERVQQLSIGDVLYTIMKYRVLIIIATIVGLMIGVLLSVVSYFQGEMSKQYAVFSSIAVVSQTEDGLFSSQSSKPNSTDVHLAESMVDSVIYIMRSNKILDAAVEHVGLVGISTRDIYNNFTLKQYNDTQIIEMTLYWRSAEEGVKILESINSVAPNILIETLKIGNVSVINEPIARYRIGGSVNASMWLYMALLGLAFGIGFSVLMLLLNPTLINTRDLETNFSLEVLGEIPMSKKYFSKKKSLLMEDDSAESEFIRQRYASAAHILVNRLGTEKNQCIFVTSAAPSDGKTSVVANLAVQLSDLEKHVLIVDFDVRHPSLGSLFLGKLEYIHSLNALYRGETTKEEAVTTLTGYLDLLPSILEHHELPLDDSMLSIIRELAKGYDYVIMDTAPVGRVANTMNLNRIAKSAIFVVGYDSTKIEDIRESLERMDKSGVRVVGCIVNYVKKLTVTRDDYSKYGRKVSSDESVTRGINDAAKAAMKEKDEEAAAAAEEAAAEDASEEDTAEEETSED